MRTHRPRYAYLLAAAVALVLAAPSATLAQLTDIASEPLAQPASNVKPNIVLILDDSGSMRQQYTPDYMGSLFGSAEEMCYDSADGGTITTTLEDCEAGDPPMMSPEVNYQYYNPEIRYYPALNFDGSSKGDMNAAATANWTAVPTDNVTTAGNNTFRVNIHEMNGDGSSETTSNLVTGWPDRAWCKTSGDDQTLSTNYPGTCRLNSQYTYPNLNYGIGKDGGGNIKYLNGAPYFYRLLPSEYCTDATLTSCQPTQDGAHMVPAPLRFCDSTSLANCQGKLIGSYTRPKYTGKIVAGGAGGQPPTKATATITVTNPQGDNFGGTIQTININGMNELLVPITAADNFTPSVVAANIAASFPSPSGYTATAAGTVVTISAPSVGASPNGYVVSVGSVGTPITRASVTFNIVDADRQNDNVSSVRIGLVELLGITITCSTANGCNGGQNSRDNWMGSAMAAQINANVGGHGFTVSTQSGGSRLIITAPVGTGGEMNGQPLTVTESGINNITGYTLSGGASSGDIETTAANFSGGADANEGRIELGQFVRTNIVPFQDPPTNAIPSTYTKYGNRTDCAAGVCSYAEEMTNFANWYAYYRSRMQMAKTAIGRAFNNLDDSYRVGFITINPSGDIAGRFLANADFDATQKQAWYQKLYDQTDHGSTPLREALARVGRYYGNITSGINSGMAASPIQVSCQPSYAILTTDGYWNGNAGQTLTGGSINNQDNVNAGFSTRTSGAYDGALAGSTDTLADVAMYYYKTDLRTDLNDNVPTTQKDNAAHQHMVTFTVGLGLAGLLNFDKNYEEQTTGDFVAIKQGTKDWPTPSSGTETTLDDLWHAAVNGRGVFFSARDPQQLSNGISEALTSVQSRVGAGAAAATSNLQPVAGDNFAFTAQYQTVVWTGDLKARTIDLSTGIVASRELWSAAISLDQRSHTERTLYTFDATDTTPPGTGNGNQLKAFCWPGAFGTGLYPGCANEAELSATEMTSFDPTTLAQYLGWTTDLSGRDTAVSAQKLVDFLRGDVANETTGGTTTTDLFRDRESLLGDIVNAQPAYVKASPFQYNTGANAGKDPYYQEFKQTTDGTTSTRKGTVYIAANDGMLHAFETDPDENPYYQTAGISTGVTSDDAFTGTLNTSPTSGEGSERFAYIPSVVMPNIKALAETTALFVHKYYVDGSPVLGDVCFGHTAAVPCTAQSNWHTIMVAGLNSGGRAYYALDVTDPDNPKGLWEFKGGADAVADGNCGMTDAGAVGKLSDCNLGLTFANPVIVKRKSDGKWVVIVTSGYNNVSPGDGLGYLYILDAQTGAILQRIGTTVGSVATPSGLGKPNAWVDNGSFDNTTLRVYAGDLEGNLWRFQLDPSAAGYNTAYKLVTLADAGGTPQPITTKPELGLVQNFGVVFVGTGKLLGTSDSGTTQSQTVYAIRDDLTNNPIGLRTGDLVQQTLSLISTTARTATANPVDFNINKGWYVDLIETGERINVDPILQLGTLVVPSNVPSNDACVAGGFGWINFFDFRTGSFIPGTTLNTASNKIPASLVVGINVIQLPGGAVKTIVTTADNQQITQETPVAPPSISGQRVSWRELVAY